MPLTRATTVSELIVARAHESPETPAVVDDVGATTYHELLGEAMALARELLDRGCAPGDRLALCLPNGREWFATYWAATLAGLVVVPIDVRSRPAEIGAMTRQCEATFLVASMDADVPDLLGTAKVLRGLATAPPSDNAASDGLLPGLDGTVRSDDVHLLQFTSGSTGLPKAAMLTHRGLLVNGRALRDAWGLSTNEAIVVPSPLSHVLGYLTGSLVPTIVGATSITMSSFAPERALDLIDRYRALGVSGTPTHHLMLVEHPERSQYDCSSLRFLMYGGAPMTPEAARRITEGLGVQALLGGFGMSETSGGVTSALPGDPLDVQLTTIGRPLPTFEVRVVDPSSGEERGAGEVGELWVRGEPVCIGYWNDPEETRRAFTPDGWLRTGDLVLRRDDGYLSFAGRMKDIMLIGGYTVAPGEIERVLAEHSAVAEALVVPAPDPRLGEIPVAFVRLVPGTEVTSGELEAHCRAVLANYKVPRYYAFPLAFPISGTGKVQRLALRDEAVRVVAATLARCSNTPSAVASRR